MPINRLDGRHWCDPASEKADEDGQWACPDCGTVWLFTDEPGYPLWETPEQQENRITMAEDFATAFSDEEE